MMASLIRGLRVPAGTLLIVAGVMAPLVNGQDLLRGPDLVQALRSGGHWICFRHAATEWTQSDRVEREGDWTSCDPAVIRQLSQEGRTTAKEVGEAVRRLGIPVGEVWSSEYCRTVETARLLALGPVRTTRQLFNLIAADLLGGRDAVVERARQFMREPVPDGTNRVLVAHGNLMQALTGVSLPEAGAVVMTYAPESGLRMIAVLEAGDWLELARLHALTR